MNIRDAKAEDKALLFAMIKDFYAPPATLHSMNKAACEAIFAEALRSNTYARILMLENEDGAVGYAILCFTWSSESGGLVVQLEELYIKDTYRGKGYGQAFFAWLREEYPAASRFRLEVTGGNTGAKHLYTKVGYTPLEYEQMIIDK